MKPNTLITHTPTGTVGRLIATHTYPDLPLSEARFGSLKTDSGTLWYPLSDMRPATPEEAAAPSQRK